MAQIFVGRWRHLMGSLLASLRVAGLRSHGTMEPPISNINILWDITKHMGYYQYYILSIINMGYYQYYH